MTDLEQPVNDSADVIDSNAAASATSANAENSATEPKTKEAKRSFSTLTPVDIEESLLKATDSSLQEAVEALDQAFGKYRDSEKDCICDGKEYTHLPSEKDVEIRLGEIELQKFQLEKKGNRVDYHSHLFKIEE